MAKDYEEIYRKPDLYWGQEPSDLVKRFAEQAPSGLALDLGMGEGRDALYLSGLGFAVTGVESTKSGVSKCESQAEERGLRIKSVVGDVRKLRINKNRYSLIIAINLFQFMTKTEASAVIENVTYGLKRGGLFLCEAFSIDDPHYKEHKKKSKELEPGVFRDNAGNIYSLFGYGEILNMCCRKQPTGKTVAEGLRPIHYAEFDYYDTTHGPAHWHGVVDFVGKKL